MIRLACPCETWSLVVCAWATLLDISWELTPCRFRKVQVHLYDIRCIRRGSSGLIHNLIKQLIPVHLAGFYCGVCPQPAIWLKTPIKVLKSGPIVKLVTSAMALSVSLAWCRANTVRKHIGTLLLPPVAALPYR